jgi:hypothetical protein
VYYTAFVLTPDRIWVRVGETYGLGAGNHGWALRLPESLPGVSVSEAQQVVAKADPDHELVEFLQPPAMFLDRVLSLGESAQYFWNPLRVPPSLLDAYLHTMGIEIHEGLSDARLRHVVKALMTYRPHGTLESIQAFVEAVTGYDALVRVGDNLMLSVLDSSFEWVPDSLVETLTPALSFQDLLNERSNYQGVRDAYPTYGSLAVRQQGRDAYEASAWEPKTKDTFQVRRYKDYPNPANRLPVEVMRDHFLHIAKATTIVNGEPTFNGDIARCIPISSWEVARGGLFARSPVGARLSLDLKMYGFDGHFVRQVTLVDNVQLHSDWEWFSTPYDAPVFLNRDNAGFDNLLLPSGVWETPLRSASPQAPPVVEPDGVRFGWNPDPKPFGDISKQPTTALAVKHGTLSAGQGDLLFRWVMGPTDELTPGTHSTPWRLVILWGSDPNNLDEVRSPWATCSETADSYQELVWRPPSGVTEAWFGIEVTMPERTPTYETYGSVQWPRRYDMVSQSWPQYETLLYPEWHGGWSQTAEHWARNAEVLQGVQNGLAYWAAPVITVSDSADIDLICVDDG